MNFCKPIAIVVFKMLAVGGVVINSLFYRGPIASQGAHAVLWKSIDFPGWESEPQASLKSINTSKIDVIIRVCGYACMQQIYKVPLKLYHYLKRKEKVLLNIEQNLNEPFTIKS